MAVSRALLLALWCWGCLACATSRRADARFALAAYAPAADYSAHAIGAGAFVADKPSASLRAALESSAAASGVRLQADARLGRAAQLLVKRSDHLPAQALGQLAELAARHLGVFDATIDASLVRLQADPAAALRPLLAAKLAEQTYTHYGAALVTRDGQRWLSVVLSQRRVMLGPVPRSVAVNTPIQLHGLLPERIVNARIELLAEGVARAVLPLGSTREFSVQLPTPRVGLYRIELVAETGAGSELLAKLPIYVGVTPPQRIELPRAQPTYDLAAIRARLLARLNLERQRAGMSPLIRDPRLEAAAQQHSADLSEHAFAAHDAPRSVGAQQRVSAAGLSPSLLLETLARGSDVSALEASVTSAAGEGRNSLMPSVTHVGIGVVALPDAYGATLLASELFAQLPLLAEPTSATPRLLSQLNQVRSKRGDAPLALDAGLCEVALRAARRFMSDATISERDAVDSAQRELERFSLSYRRVDALLTLTHDLDAAATLEPALDPRAAGLGIGIVEGQRAEQGAVLAVVLIVGTRR